MASMIGDSLAVTVNASRFDPSLAEAYPVIAISLEVREKNIADAALATGKVLDTIGSSWTALRIDSALRGPVPGLVGPILARGRVLVTDTIPEYGRRTENGETIFGTQAKNIEHALQHGGVRNERRELIIADSQNDNDLRSLAKRCIRENLIPVDPGPLISMVVKEMLFDKTRPEPTIGKKNSRSLERVAFVIGSRDDMTMNQLRSMEHQGYPIKTLASRKVDDVSIFSFSLEREAEQVNDSFVDSLVDYDAIVLSGGATASFVLERSGFKHILNDGQVQPLISTGRIVGGRLDGKLVVLKGGFIGDENTYKTILGWLTKR